jgi:UDP-N-acetylglucosamine--N-acetylmuramyl-(pentapeptide) pyrophosphoryl-undecaprenol N-acetylglucosamine transferase
MTPFTAGNASPLIVFAGGGTAGPVTPLLAVATAIRAARPEARFLWIGTAQGPEARLVAAAGLPFVAVSAGKLRRYFDLRNLLSPFQALAGFFQAWRVLGREPVAAVVSAGGFVAAPVIWAAWCRRLPVHVHQQDLRPTLTNVITAPFAASVTVAFEKSAADFQRFKPTVTGNPVRPAVLAGSADEARRLWNLEAGVPVVLVVGGGNGSANLNALVRGALPLLVAGCQVLHVAGTGKTDAAVTAAHYRQFELLTDGMPHALAIADLVVTRAGLGTLSELAVLGKPTVIMPMAGTHQEDNARFFADRGAAVYLDERETFSKSFADLVLGLLADGERCRALGQAMKIINPPGAADKIAATILTLIH